MSDKIESPPPELVSAILDGKCIAFVGAGLSRNAGLPGWRQLMVEMNEWAYRKGCLDARAKDQLDVEIEKGTDLPHIAEDLRRLMEEEFLHFLESRFRDLDLKPKKAHELIIEIPFAAIVTTNFDMLLEDAYAKIKGKAARTHTQEEAREFPWLQSLESFYIWKIHGDIAKPGTIVLGKKEYRKATYGLPAYQDCLKALLTKNTVLFLGYGLEDPDILGCLDFLLGIYGEGTKIQHYALMDTTEMTERQRQWYARDYGIEVIGYRASSSKHPEVRRFLQNLHKQVQRELKSAERLPRGRARDKLQEYLECIRDRCGTIRLARILSEEALSVRPASTLEDLFVPPAFRPEPTLQVSPPPSTGMEVRRERESEPERDRRDLMTDQGVAATTIEQDLLLTDFFPQKRHFVVLGPAGSGKTTLLQYIAFNLAQGQGSQIGFKEPHIPIWIGLRKFAEELGQDPGLSPLSFVQKELEARELEVPMRFFTDHLGEGQCVVLFDGLDEVTSSEQRDEVVKSIRRFTRDFEGNLFVMTSRKEGYEEGAHLDPASFPCYNLQPFSSERIKEFLGNWYRHRGETDEQEINKLVEVTLKAIRKEENIADLAKNPLMLVIIAALGQKGELPHRRIGIYKRCVDLLLGEWRRESLAEWELDGVGALYLKARAGFVGYWVHKHERSSVGLERGKRWQELASDLAGHIREREDDPNPQREADNFLKYLVQGAGILEQSEEEGQPTFRFIHNAFLDYLAAYHTSRRVKDRIISPDDMADVVLKHLHDERWLEWTLLAIEALEALGPQSTLVRTILDAESESEDILYRDKLLAGRLLAEDVEVRTDLQDHVLDALASIARTKVVRLQTQSLDLLGDMNFKLYRNGALAWLRDIAISYKGGEPKDIFRAAKAALSIAKLDGWRKAFPILEDILLRDDISSIDEIVYILNRVDEEWPEHFVDLVVTICEAKTTWELDFKEWPDFEQEDLNPDVYLLFRPPDYVRILITSPRTSENERKDVVAKVRQLAQGGSAEQREQAELLRMRILGDFALAQLQNWAENAQSDQVRIAAAETLAAKGARSEALSALEPFVETASGSLRQRVARDLMRLGESTKALPIFVKGAYEIHKKGQTEALQSLADIDRLAVAIPGLIARAVLGARTEDWGGLASFLKEQRQEELAKNLLLEAATGGELDTYSQRGIIQGLAQIDCEEMAVGLCLDWLERSRGQRQRLILIANLWAMGRYRDAARWLQTLTKEKIDDEEVQFYVTSMWVSRFWQEQIQELEKENRREHPTEDSGEVVGIKSIIESRSERRDAILGEMDRALQQEYPDIEWYQGYRAKAQVLKQWRRPREALDAVKRAMEICADNVENLEIYADLLRLIGSYEEAANVYGQARKMAKDPDVRRYFSSGQRIALTLAGKSQEAIELLGQAIQLEGDDPNCYVYYWQRGIAHREAGNLKMALEDFDKSLHLATEKLDSDSKEFFEKKSVSFSRGLTYLLQGNCQLAEQDLRRSLEADDDLESQLYPVYLIGLALAKQGQLEEAQQEFQRALDISTRLWDRNPEEPYQHVNAIILLALSKPKEALEAISDAQASGLFLEEVDNALSDLPLLEQLWPETPGLQDVKEVLERIRKECELQTEP